MTQESVISDELRGYVGRQTDPIHIEIDRTLINRYADAIGDTNPLWTDRKAAAKGPYGTIVAPPALYATVLMRGLNPWDPIRHLLPPNLLDGGGEWEIIKPAKIGDTITVVNTIADISERQGRSGPMVLLTIESSWTNQNNEEVAKAKATAIFL